MAMRHCDGSVRPRKAKENAQETMVRPMRIQRALHSEVSLDTSTSSSDTHALP